MTQPIPVPPILPTGQSGAVRSRPSDARLWEAAQAFEATFLTEMLKSTGLGDVPGAFGGGVGEDQFASLLREAQAKEMAEAGGIGLAEAIFEALKERHYA